MQALTSSAFVLVRESTPLLYTFSSCCQGSPYSCRSR
jgi:hypothetical protein